MSRKLVFIGRTPEGEQYYLESEVTYQQGEHTTTEHSTVSGITRLSMSGILISKYGSITRNGNRISCGQNRGNLARVIKVDGGFLGDLAEIQGIWERWHLNDMKSKCAHQNPETKWDETPPCPETGYKAGDAWLAEELPSEVLTRIYELGLIHTSDYARVVMERVAQDHPLN